MFKLELLLLEALTQGEVVQPACIGRRERVTPRGRALPQLKVQRVLLLLDVQPAVLGRRARPQRVAVRADGQYEDDQGERATHEQSDPRAARTFL